MSNKENKFSVTDPLNRHIVLTNERWEEHIKDRHDEVDIEKIQSNIENPRYIIQNIKPKEKGSDELVIDTDRQDYVDFIIRDDKLYVIKTIVHFESESEGNVVTNYILRKANEIKTGGGVIYDSNESKSATKFISI